MPLRTIIEENVVGSPAYFDIFSLDVEGAEFEALASLDFSKAAFGIVLVEADEHNLRKNMAVRAILERNGYIRFGNISAIVNGSSIRTLILSTRMWCTTTRSNQISPSLCSRYGMCYMYLLFIIVSITFFGLITSFDYDYDKMGGVLPGTTPWRFQTFCRHMVVGRLG
jgi:hypothetical protein